MVLSGTILTVTASWLHFTPEKGSVAFNLKTRKTIIITHTHTPKTSNLLIQKSLATLRSLVGERVRDFFPRRDTSRPTPGWPRAWCTEDSRWGVRGAGNEEEENASEDAAGRSKSGGSGFVSRRPHKQAQKQKLNYTGHKAIFILGVFTPCPRSSRGSIAPT